MAMVQEQAATLTAAFAPEEQQQQRLEVRRATVGDKPTLESIFTDAFTAHNESLMRMFPPGVGEEYQRRAWTRFARWGELQRDSEETTGDESEAVNVDGLEPGERQREHRRIKAHECNVLVVRDDKGSVLSATLVWVVRPGDGGVRPWRQRWPAAIPGMATAEWVAFQRGMAAQHQAAVGSEPHVYVEIIMTHSSARRRGHASALLRAVCAVADRRRCPVYLDAMPDALALFARHGFVPCHKLLGADDAMLTCPMVRPVTQRSLI